MPLVDESSIVKTMQFKRIPEDFGWPPPIPSFYRHQQIKLRLMPRTELLDAGDFTWQLHQGDQESPLPVVQTDQGNQIVYSFAAGSHPDEPWRANQAAQRHTLRLEAIGKTPGDGRPPVLEGFQREFPPWVYSVRNTLPLRFRDPSSEELTLSLRQQSVEVIVETQFEDAVDGIPISVRLTPPSLPDHPEVTTKALSKHFRLTWSESGESIELMDNEALIKLSDGSARLTLTFQEQPDARLPSGAAFAPGELTFTPAVSELSAAGSVTSRLQLVIDRPCSGLSR